MTLVAAALAVAKAPAAIAGGVPQQKTASTGCSDANWTTYGRDNSLSFEVPRGCSSINPSNVATLLPKWFFYTGSTVTASPAVVNGVLYVGSWNGTFYAINAATGQEIWQHKISVTLPTAFGDIVGSAAVVPFPDASTGHDRLVVIFGGGSHLYALDAATGKQLAALDVDPRSPSLIAKQSSNPPVVEIESSPAVADVRIGGQVTQMIYVGMDVHNDAGVGPAGLIATRLVSNRNGSWSFVPVWKSDPETGIAYQGPESVKAGSGSDYGCGDVWSSPAVDAASDSVVYGVGNCDDAQAARAAGHNWSEAIVEVRADTGKLVWRYSPVSDLPPSQQLNAALSDFDFGSSPNLFTLPDGKEAVGEASKNGYYYARAAQTGAALWATQAASPGLLSQNFSVGGFIGSTAVETDADGRAQRIIGASAIPIPQNLQQLEMATWDVRALDATTGKIDWVFQLGGPSYAATTVVNGMALVPDTVPSDLVALNAATGDILWLAPVLGPPSSAAVVVGNSVYLGTGTTETDLEYKSLGLLLPQDLTALIGQGPLDLVSGIQAWSLP